MDEGLARRLGEIEKRLTAIEAALSPIAAPPPIHTAVPAGVDRPLAVAMPAAADTADLPFAVPVAIGHAAVPAVVARGPVLPPPLPRAPAIRPVDVDEFGYPRDEQPSISPAGVGTSYATASAPPNASASTPPSWVAAAQPTSPAVNLEQTLGLKWAGWIGAVVLVIGAALGVKFAYDQGWLGSLPPAARWALIVSAGVGLVVAGEAVYRRVNRLSATGLYGAGVSVLYLAAYAGQAWYALFSPGGALVMMVTAAAAGMMIAARADLVSVAAISVLGAGIGAAASGAPHGSGLLLPYLLCIEIMAVGLCAWRAAPKWWTLRGLSLAVTTVGAITAIAYTPTLPRVDAAAIVYVVLMAALYQGELIYTTLRMAVTRFGEWTRGLTFSVLTTFALAIELLAICEKLPATTRGLMLLGLAGVVFGVARLVRRPVAFALSRGFDVQAFLLLTLVIPILLRGPGVTFGWMALATALAAVAIFTRSRLASGSAAAVWALAAIGAFGWADESPRATQAWLSIAGQAVAAIVVLGACLALSGHLVAVAFHRRRPPTPGRVDLTPGLLMDFVAAGVFALLLLTYAPPALATWTGLAYALLLWAASYAPAGASLATVSIALLSAVAVKWALLDVLGTRFSKGWHPVGRPVLNAQVAAGVTIATALAIVGRSRGLSSAATTVLGLAMLLFVGSMEIDRYAVQQTAGPVWIVRQVGWSIYWALLAVATLAAGFALARPAFRQAALGLLGLTLLKVVLIDLHGAGTGWRILSFLGLGVLLLLTSVLYGKFSRPAATGVVQAESA